MVFQEMNHPFGPMFAQQMMDPHMFVPAGYPSNQITSNMPPPLGHLNSNMNQYQQQYIHSQMFQNLQQHFQPQMAPNMQVPGPTPNLYHNRI